MTDKAGEWVEFTADFNFVPSAARRSAVAYKKGMRLRVTEEAATAAKAAGRAESSTNPRTDGQTKKGASDGSGTTPNAD